MSAYQSRRSGSYWTSWPATASVGTGRTSATTSGCRATTGRSRRSSTSGRRTSNSRARSICGVTWVCDLGVGCGTSSRRRVGSTGTMASGGVSSSSVSPPSFVCVAALKFPSEAAPVVGVLTQIGSVPHWVTYGRYSAGIRLNSSVQMRAPRTSPSPDEYQGRSMYTRNQPPSRRLLSGGPAIAASSSQRKAGTT